MTPLLCLLQYEKFDRQEHLLLNILILYYSFQIVNLTNYNKLRKTTVKKLRY